MTMPIKKRHTSARAVILQSVDIEGKVKVEELEGVGVDDVVFVAAVVLRSLTARESIFMFAQWEKKKYSGTTQFAKLITDSFDKAHKQT